MGVHLHVTAQNLDCVSLPFLLSPWHSCLQRWGQVLAGRRSALLCPALTPVPSQLGGFSAPSETRHPEVQSPAAFMSSLDLSPAGHLWASHACRGYGFRPAFVSPPVPPAVPSEPCCRWPLVRELHSQDFCREFNVRQRW